MRLNKKRYIEKHGEEAWKAESVRRKNKRGNRNEYFRDRRKRLSEDKNERAKVILKAYNRDDKSRGFDISNNIDYSWIVDKIFSGSCTYCGDSDWKHLGADRIDNDKPHTQDNCICSCGVCNVERQCKSMSVSEFVEYRKNHLRGLDKLPSPEVVDVNGIKLIKKRVF